MSKTVEIELVTIPLNNIDYIERDYDYFHGFTIFLKSGRDIHCDDSKLYDKVAQAIDQEREDD